jgi:integrase
VRLPDGSKVRISGCPTLNTKIEAEREERDHIARVLAPPPPVEEKEVQEVPTVGEFSKEFMRTYVKANNKPSEIAQKTSVLKRHIVPKLGAVKLDGVIERLEPFKADLLAKGLSRKSVNNILAVLSKMLRYAEERRILAEAPRVRLLKVAMPDFDFLSFDEYELLLRAAAPHPEWYAAILAAGDAGMRMGEIIALEWKDVDFPSGNLRIRRSSWYGVVGTTKGGRERVVPMTRRLAAALKAVRHLRGPLVFSSMDGQALTPGRMDKPLSKLAKQAGLRDIGWHALRHTFCSHLAMRGAAPVAVQKLAGHESVTTTQRYMHLQPTMLHETIALLDDRGEGQNSWQKSGKKKEWV